MTVGVAEIEHWDPQAVRDIGRAAADRAESAAATSAALAGLPAYTTWAGVAADAARASIGRIRADLDGRAAEARRVVRATDLAAAAITTVKADLRRVQDAARAAGTGVEPAALAAVLARADAVDAELARAFRFADGRLPGPRSPARPAIPPLSTPEQVKRWWDSLRPEERSRWLAGDPDRLGNLDGIPAADRDIANRAALGRDVDRVAGAAADHRVPVDDVTADPQSYGLTAADAVRYANAVNTRAALDANARRSSCPTYLLTYQPEAFLGQGRAAVAINNPDEAPDTAVVVPGTGHSVAGGWLGADDAPNLYAELARAVPAGRRPSVVAWMGYDAPAGPTDPRVGMTGLAQEGGALLASDVNALAVTHLGPSHLTVIGHSYGATTVADAAAGHGMRADDVVLLGCPGTDLARGAADFGLPDGGHVYVGSASTDPVTQFGRLPQVHLGQSGVAVALGPDPAADGFGSTRFKAEVPGLSILDHTAYYRPGSESLFSIADIASGNGAALQSHGMTAPHRDSVLADVVASLSPAAGEVLRDPELLRPGTGGHRHR